MIGFDGIKDSDEWKLLKDLPTTFKLSAGSLDRLRAVAATLLIASPVYRKLLKDLK